LPVSRLALFPRERVRGGGFAPQFRGGGFAPQWR
jgi:hypothetical protein